MTKIGAYSMSLQPTSYEPPLVTIGDKDWRGTRSANLRRP
jgi:hypothetical protein